jgi:sec-independent protein translocase protein TatA
MAPLGLFGTFGPGELLVLLLILILLFGARKIPDLARALGEGIRNFRSGMREDRDRNRDGRGGTSGGAES